MALSSASSIASSEEARPGSPRAVAWVVGFLVAVGVLAALTRYLLPHALHLRLAAPLYGSYAPDQLPVLARHPISEALHRFGGALYLALGAAQFARGLRERRPALHRWMGRGFVALSLVAGGTGAYMGVAFPYEPGERAPSVIFAALMAGFALKGLAEIRRGRVAAHRAWMLRSFAVGLGIATIRVLAVAALHATPWTTRQLIAPIFWIGWTSTLAVAELLLRARRSHVAAR